MFHNYLHTQAALSLNVTGQGQRCTQSLGQVSASKLRHTIKTAASGYSTDNTVCRFYCQKYIKNAGVGLNMDRPNIEHILYLNISFS